MILACPRCATRYLVGEEQVGPQGRKVKCTSCGDVWIAWPQPDEAEPPLQAPPEPPEPLTELPEFKHPRSHARPQRPKNRRALWFGLAFAITGVGAAALVFRQDVVRQWPGAARAYAAVGLASS